jgi:hypothetical protein
MSRTVTKNKTAGWTEDERENLPAAYVKVIHERLSTISTIKTLMNINKI